jgi:hypothetical protein
MLPKHTLPDHYPDYNSMSVGEQIHGNHIDCPAGVDNKRRLYIRRADTSMWLLHCHHCGDSGVFRSKEPRSMLSTATPTTSKAFSGPIDFHQWYDFCRDLGLSKKPTATQSLWLDHIDGGLLEDYYGVMYNTTNNDIYLPIFYDRDASGGLIVGYQVRHFGPGAKYTTHMFTDDSFAFYEISSKVLIVCEDIVSMLWCIQNGFSVVCLLGTKEPTWEKFAEAIQKAKPRKVLLWLDDDPAGHSGVIKLIKAMPLVLGSVPFDTMLNGCPKYFTKEQMDDLRDSLSKGA